MEVLLKLKIKNEQQILAKLNQDVQITTQRLKTFENLLANPHLLNLIDFLGEDVGKLAFEYVGSWCWKCNSFFYGSMCWGCFPFIWPDTDTTTLWKAHGIIRYHFDKGSAFIEPTCESDKEVFQYWRKFADYNPFIQNSYLQLSRSYGKRNFDLPPGTPISCCFDHPKCIKVNLTLLN